MSLVKGVLASEGILGKRINISIIGYKNHASRLKNILEELGYENIVTFNHHTDNVQDISTSDVFFIASPNETHLGWIERLKGYGKYIFCEKPPVANIGELKAIKEYDNKLYFNFNYRFSRLSKRVKEYSLNGELGKPLYVNCISSHGLAFKESFQKNWRFKGKNIFSSIVGNVGIHYIDLIGYLFGKIIKIDIKNLSVTSNELSDSCKVTIDAEDCLADLFLSYAAPFRNETTVIYDNGILKLSNGTLTIETPRDTYDENGRFTNPPTVRLDEYDSSREYYDDSLRESVHFFMSCVHENKDIPKTHYSQSIHTNELLLEASAHLVS